MSLASHCCFGGVVVLSWYILHYSWVEKPITATAFMTAEKFLQTLQLLMMHIELGNLTPSNHALESLTWEM